MPPKRKANKPMDDAVDTGLKKKRVGQEEFVGDDADDIDVKQIENIKPKRGGKAVESKSATEPKLAAEGKSRAKGKAPVVKSTKKDGAKSNLDEGESDSSVESKKDAPVKTTKKSEKKVPATDNKRKARGGNEGPSSKTARSDKELSPELEEDVDDEVPASSKSSKPAPKGKGRGAKAAQSKGKGAKKNDEDVAEIAQEEEREPENSPEEEPKKRTATKASKKMILEAIEDDDAEPQNSSDDEPKKKITKPTKKNAKKPQDEVVEPEDVSSDESKKKAPVSKRGKRTAKKDADQKEDSEPEDDGGGDSKKTAPAEKASKKEIVQEDESEPEDVSSDDSKKKIPAAKGTKKTAKKEATGTASRGRPAKTADKKEKLNPTETSYETVDFSSDKRNKAGDVHNLRIASWNVGGIKAWVKKDGLQYVLNEKPDIFCIQETKCNSETFPEEIEDIEGYKFYWHASAKDGYAGVSLWSRVEPIEVQYGIGNEEQDVDGRCITAEFEKYYVICVYVPNAGRKLVTLPKRLEWNKLFKNFVKELDAKKPVIICGDLNVAHTETDLANPKTNTKNAGFTPEEREGLTEFLNEGFVDTYRHFNPDTTGAYTFWTYMSKSRSKNVGWRLDYFVTSDRLKDNLCDSLIRSSVLGSDHCPIVLFLNI